MSALQDLAPAPAPALYTSLAVKRLASAEQSTNCITAAGNKKCNAHLAHHYTMSLKAFMALNPAVCAEKGATIPARTAFCYSSRVPSPSTPPLPVLLIAPHCACLPAHCPWTLNRTLPTECSTLYSHSILTVPATRAVISTHHHQYTLTQRGRTVCRPASRLRGRPGHEAVTGYGKLRMGLERTDTCVLGGPCRVRRLCSRLHGRNGLAYICRQRPDLRRAGQHGRHDAGGPEGAQPPPQLHHAAGRLGGVPQGDGRERHRHCLRCSCPAPAGLGQSPNSSGMFRAQDAASRLVPAGLVTCIIMCWARLGLGNGSAAAAVQEESPVRAPPAPGQPQAAGRCASDRCKLQQRQDRCSVFSLCRVRVCHKAPGANLCSTVTLRLPAHSRIACLLQRGSPAVSCTLPQPAALHAVQGCANSCQ